MDFRGQTDGTEEFGMASRNTMRQEIEELRQEVEALRRARSAPPKRAAKARTSATKRPAKSNKPLPKPSDISDIDKAIEDLVKNAEKELGDNPLVGLALAFMLGMLAGRVIGR
jgi:ElaB/YqjD/DUF883 family membrane-anchored ribosome-binding protein